QSSPTTQRSMLPVGTHRLHDDVSINFQLHRWIAWTGGDALSDIRRVAPRLSDYATDRRLFLELADAALAEGDLRRAAFHVRAAEFFVRGDDPDKQALRRRFVELIWLSRAMSEADRDRVPYGDGWLPAYRFATEQAAKGTVVVFGGFDSYIEELFAITDALCTAGWDVVAFEGPGQGGALEEAGLPFEVEWEHPVAAVLDHYALSDVSVLGISLGGGLAVRAAAFEPRVRRLICDDILFDFLDVSLHQLPAVPRAALTGLLRAGADRAVDTLVHRAMRRSPVLDWGLHQGMHVFGVDTPADFLTTAARFRTDECSPRVTADTLLLAGAEDHYVPVRQFHQQMAALSGARSVSGHILTRADHAQDHCHVGNVGLSLDLITGWLDQMVALDAQRAERAGQPADHPAPTGPIVTR
ncbi:alpha/beta fold hydrolase, partial [Nocardioides sp.]|uniref:alpha/beta fold hydrolase n=1 Tax=Nocardioides sp. TaxID=35761 RepID=UPI00286D8E5F